MTGKVNARKRRRIAAAQARLNRARKPKKRRPSALVTAPHRSTGETRVDPWKRAKPNKRRRKRMLKLQGRCNRTVWAYKDEAKTMIQKLVQWERRRELDREEQQKRSQEATSR